MQTLPVSEANLETEEHMTTTLIAPCGLDCAQCDAYKLTLANDPEDLQALLEKWRVEYSAPDMALADVTCDGCLAGERHGGYCAECPIRACAVDKGHATCATCDEYGCEKLEGFLQRSPQARQNLEALRT
jgi:hypothetical protein